MSLGEKGSSYDAMSRDRTRVRIATWNSLGVGDSDGSPKYRCRNCLEQWKMILKEIEGQKVYWCHGCNKTVLAEQTNVDISNKKYQNKYGTAAGKSNTMIVSQKTKKDKHPGQVTDEDKQDLSFLGSSGCGATLIDERTECYQDGARS